jgi:hypothetical protein
LLDEEQFYAIGPGRSASKYFSDLDPVGNDYWSVLLCDHITAGSLQIACDVHPFPGRVGSEGCVAKHLRKRRGDESFSCSAEAITPNGEAIPAI